MEELILFLCFKDKKKIKSDKLPKIFKVTEAI